MHRAGLTAHARLVGAASQHPPSFDGLTLSYLALVHLLEFANKGRPKLGIGGNVL